MSLGEIEGGGGAAARSTSGFSRETAAVLISRTARSPDSMEKFVGRPQGEAHGGEQAASHRATGPPGATPLSLPTRSGGLRPEKLVHTWSLRKTAEG